MLLLLICAAGRCKLEANGAAHRNGRVNFFLLPYRKADSQVIQRILSYDGICPNLFAVGRCKLEAILVLRIQDGNDIFLAAGGAYAPSFFGLSLTTLSGLPRCATVIT